MELTSLIRKNILDITPYSSARDEYEFTADVYLDANENPYSNGVNRYPDPHHKTLTETLARLKGVIPQNMILGNGSDEILDMVFRCFCNPGQDNVITTPPTYGMYKVLAQLNDVQCKEVPLTPDFNLDITALLDAVDEHTKIIFLCSPNNPSGNLLNPTQIADIMQQFNGIVLLDEAYIDFAPHASFLPLLVDFPRLIICQTLSKAWAMAGLRIGIGIASPDIIRFMQKIKPPYNINRLSLDKAQELLQDEEGFRERVLQIASEKQRLSTALTAFPFVKKVYDSDANFLLVKFDDATATYQQLIKQGIVVRNRSSQPLCDNCLRLTVGLATENDALLTALNNC